MQQFRRLPNETKKQLAVRIETVVKKAYSLNTHDYKNTKMTKILMMTLTPQLRKIALKKSTSHPSSIRELDIESRKLVDKLEQAEITLKLEETKNSKLQYVSNFHSKTSHINIIQDSDNKLAEKIFQIPIIYEKNPNLKNKPSFKNLTTRQLKGTSKTQRTKHMFLSKHEKNQNLPYKNIQKSEKPLPDSFCTNKSQFPYRNNFRGRSSD